jgi:hypothetical protein
MDAADLRVSDAERDAAVERLRSAAHEGRLAPEELEERTGRALTARTRGELAAVLGDLPQETLPDAASGNGTVAPRGRPSEAVLRRRAAAFLTPNLICIAIWAATGAGSFWPGWVILGTGIAFGTFLVRYALGVEEAEEREDQERRHRGRPRT